ncbi:MAG: DNA-processing protein DprA [Defluviicoccus sp.]|nr:DNA-processing protein DprA [Defluviicoccus sp.]MDE0278755.1 DNA-processing protein DprA [Defluviicoccus sp.]
MIENLGTQAALLLTVSLGKADRDGTKPLSPREWARLTTWLEDRGFDPSALITGDPRDVLAGWDEPSIAPDRLDRLLGRGAALGLAAEKWHRAGLWTLARSDSGYPTRLEERLGRTAPPVLFGCGNRLLLGRGGLAVVGSRDASEDDLAFSEDLGKAASRQGYSVVSGGARGVDRSAMKGAFGSEGTAVAVLADSLLRAATSALYRRPLLSGDLALVSAVNPEARFNVGNAMARNRYIYCLADAAVVVASAHGSGGTWNGARENAKAGWVPLWVKRTSEPDSGNVHLVAKGARWLPDPLTSVVELFGRQDVASAPVLDGVSEETRSWETPSPAIPGDLEFFDLFLARLTAITAEGPVSEAQISERLNVAKGQVKEWIKRGVTEEGIERVTGPVRYRVPHRERPSASQTSDPEHSVRAGSENLSPPLASRLEFQDLFLHRVRELTAHAPRSSASIARSLGVAPGQVNKWLGRGVAEGKIEKTESPIRYAYARPSLFSVDTGPPLTTPARRGSRRAGG